MSDNAAFLQFVGSIDDELSLCVGDSGARRRMAVTLLDRAWFEGYKAGSEYVMSCLDRQLSSDSNSAGEHPINDAATRTR